ncbi:TetR/AcrR family transcriptional regulator [Novosphingobium sediminicola]|uniref:AcrR family transcriptional regulator n=1 Tax=Novosphingobium sediminicola TaxID=563162 RepID=A0A7W6CDT9_9SPHN|nr:TetR/AcrR family transcriptional regulator C-terminal domain-containing protein [Novosphingobium sediminicola]MBB3953640.1 AcrR family transcriptional regulator [Novosphingobium sediminicola]
MSRSPEPKTSAETRVSKADAAQTRRAALIAHTRQQMLLHGPHNVSLAEVLRLAGGSKATVAKYFGGRDGLIAATMLDTAQTAMQELALAEQGTSVEEALENLLTGILSFYLQPESIAVYRGVIACGGTDASAGQIFYQSGHKKIVEECADFLDRWKGRGLRDDLSSLDAAGQLVHAIRSGLYEETLLGLRAVPVDGASIRERARAVTLLFLAGAAPRLA